MSETITASVAAEVRAELARQRMSQQLLAAKLGVSQQWVSRRIAGTVAFDVNELARIAGLLGVPMSQFLPVPAAA
jgi:transcriptional regulator with XRE-family HTH domain